jgi:hypothetical protein
VETDYKFKYITTKPARSKEEIMYKLLQRIICGKLIVLLYSLLVAPVKAGIVSRERGYKGYMKEFISNFWQESYPFICSVCTHCFILLHVIPMFSSILYKFFSNSNNTAIINMNVHNSVKIADKNNTSIKLALLMAKPNKSMK